MFIISFSYPIQLHPIRQLYPIRGVLLWYTPIVYLGLSYTKYSDTSLFLFQWKEESYPWLLLWNFHEKIQLKRNSWKVHKEKQWTQFFFFLTHSSSTPRSDYNPESKSYIVRETSSPLELYLLAQFWLPEKNFIFLFCNSSSRKLSEHSSQIFVVWLLF